MRQVVTLGLLVVAVVLTISLLGVPQPDPVSEEPASEDLYRFDGQESGVWLYVSTQPAVTRHGPMNLVVQASTEEIVRALTNTPDSDAAAESGANATTDRTFEPTARQWKRTKGAARYTYVSDGDSGQWIRETAHVMDGTYYGARHHARLYESPHESERWTAIQAHSEHFDWFTLGHVVENVEYAQAQVERDLTNDQQSVTVRQVDFDNEDADGDGWASIIVLTMALLPAGLALLGSADRGGTSTDGDTPVTLRERFSLPVAGLTVTIFALVLGVRAGGLVFELLGVPVDLIGIVLYPFIGVGIPVATGFFASRIERATDAALTATVSLTAAMLVDYVIVDLVALPLVMVLHRSGLVLGLGLIAGGATVHTRPGVRFARSLRLGALCWFSVSIAGLFLL
jgi:hypothetical protein